MEHCSWEMADSESLSVDGRGNPFRGCGLRFLSVSPRLRSNVPAAEQLREPLDHNSAVPKLKDS